MKKPGVYIIICALILVGLTLVFPRRTAPESGNIRKYGFPFHYISQETSFDYPMDVSVPLGDIREHPTRVRWGMFFVNIILVSAVLFGVLKIKGARDQKVPQSK